MSGARRFHVVLEQHDDGWVAHALGLDAIVVGEGDTFEKAVADIRSAIAESIETFGEGIVDDNQPSLALAVAIPVP